MHLLPSTLSRTNDVSGSISESDDAMEQDVPPRKAQQQVLVLNQTGVISLVSPVDELLYLRLNALQTYLTAQLDHACGLNPRGYRAAENSGDALGGGAGAGSGGIRGGGIGGIKGVVDGSLLKRWAELPKQRQMDACTRVGVEMESLRNDLESVGGEGLGFL
jgi:cleavage and polyadenylation specificity factor subunit 1